MLTSLLLHIGIAAAAVFPIGADPSKGTLPVIDLTLVSPAGTGSATGADRSPSPPPHANPGPSIARSVPPPPHPGERGSSRPAAEEETAPPAAAPAAAVRPFEPYAARTAGASGAEGSRAAPAASSPGSVSGSPSAPATSVPARWPGPGGEGPGSEALDARSRYLERNYSYIREAIQHGIPYPAIARRMGWEGKVVVGFQVLTDGSVRNVRVVDGSGHAVLDRSAVLAVQGASPFPRPPVEAEIITPVVYRLE